MGLLWAVSFACILLSWIFWMLPNTGKRWTAANLRLMLCGIMTHTMDIKLDLCKNTDIVSFRLWWQTYCKHGLSKLARKKSFYHTEFWVFPELEKHNHWRIAFNQHAYFPLRRSLFWCLSKSIFGITSFIFHFSCFVNLNLNVQTSKGHGRVFLICFSSTSVTCR